jgi:hypothetical protein
MQMFSEGTVDEGGQLPPDEPTVTVALAVADPPVPVAVIV